MKRLLPWLLFTLFLSALQPAYSKNFFVKSGGSGDGTSWNSAWAGPAKINWGSLASGDVVYIAGGSYPGACAIGTAGISLLRVKASDKAATDAAGWQASFDSTVIINVAKGTAGIYTTGSTGDSLTIDGRQPGGITINISDASSGIEFSGQAPKNVTIRYVNTVGPGKITQTGDVRGMDLTPGSGPMSNLKIQYCDCGGGGDSGVYLLYADNALIEYSSFHSFDAVNAAQYHQNLIYCGTITNSTFRFNKFYDIQTESLFFGDPNNKNIYIYGNQFYNGSIPKNTGRSLQFDNASSGNVGIMVYNNTMASLPLGTQLGSGSFSGCVFQNNLSWGQTTNLAAGWTDANNITPTTDPFVASSTFNYRLKANNNAGANLGAPYNVDFDGNPRPASGPWDSGAFQFVKGGTPTPNPTATPTPNPTATPSPTATPNPTATPSPTPGAKFKVGDKVLTLFVTNIRATPGGTLLGQQPEGEPGTIQAGPQNITFQGETLDWYQVVFAALPNGWCGDDNLEKATAPSPTPTPNPTATPSPTATPNPTATPTPGAPTYNTWIQQQNDWTKAHPPVPDP